jgi:Family of unknown function (DUF6308)
LPTSALPEADGAALPLLTVGPAIALQPSNGLRQALEVELTDARRRAGERLAVCVVENVHLSTCCPVTGEVVVDEPLTSPETHFELGIRPQLDHRGRIRRRALPRRLGGSTVRPVDLIYGAGRLDRPVGDVEDLLREWRVREADWGQLYLDFQPATPPDVLLVEDLAATMLINSRVAGQAAAAVLRHGSSVDLARWPDKPLEETTVDERRGLADLLGTMTSCPWVGASLATKTLHKKRPHLIPVLDNQAIFGAYMKPGWPEERSFQDTIKSTARIYEALEWVFSDLTRPENAETWLQLARIEPERTRIELFDCVWWIYFRRLEPVGSPPVAAE